VSEPRHEFHRFDPRKTAVESAQLINEKIEVLEQKLRAQAELYRSLMDLARKQAEKISAENVDELVLCLEEKKRVVEEIEAIEVDAAPLREFWETNKDNADEQIRAGLRAAVDEIRALLEELLELEAQSQRKLGASKDALQDQIRDLSTGSQAISSYAPSPDQSPRFMDQKG